MKAIDLKTRYILNPAYKFRNDITSVVVTNADSLYFDSLDQDEKTFKNFAWKIPPLVAYLFSFFDGSETFTDTLNHIVEQTNSSCEVLTDAILPFIENEDNKVFPLALDSEKGCAISLPKNFLIPCDPKWPRRALLKDINVKKIHTEFDISSGRLNIPNELMIMITNKCVTNCIYCYADRGHKMGPEMPFDRVKELITEARELNCRSVDIGGGELFQYGNWFELIQCLISNEYMPYISTKVPFDEEILLKLKSLGVDRIQISLDTINPDKIKKILNVNENYLDAMKRTLENLEKHKMKFRIKSVITNINDTLEDIESLTKYLSQFRMLKEVSIAPGEFSLYKPFTYSSALTQIRTIEEYVNKIKESYPCNLSMQGAAEYPVPQSFEEKHKEYSKRGLCSGNVSSFYILPDGKATLCEQIYWHPFFILGDCCTQSIIEVWNSEKAMNLWNISQQDIRNGSACKTCPEFEVCRRGKGNCWRFAMEAYGLDNYDFPTYTCPYAPPPTVNMFHK